MQSTVEKICKKKKNAAARNKASRNATVCIYYVYIQDHFLICRLSSF